MSESSVHVSVNKLVAFMVDACVAMSIPQQDAKIIADVLITSDLWGVRSHGIAHLKMYHARIKADPIHPSLPVFVKFANI